MTPPGPVRRWVLAARPRTLPAAVVPVAVGAASVEPRSVSWLNTLLCVIVALALQVGTNFANDYSDGVRGTDEGRVGPFRLTASKLVPARRVLYAAWIAFSLSGIAGVILSSRSSWWLVLVGVSAVFAGWFYTGGPRPYGYMGLGEVFVFFYFGIVATVGTAFVQHRTVPGHSWWLAVGVGAMACALLEANNLRDVDGDRVSRKMTLAARLGRARASWLYGGCVGVVFVGFLVAGQAVGAAVAVLAFAPALRLAFSKRQGRELLPLLVYTARVQLLLGAFMTVVVAASS